MECLSNSFAPHGEVEINMSQAMEINMSSLFPCVQIHVLCFRIACRLPERTSLLLYESFIKNGKNLFYGTFDLQNGVLLIFALIIWGI